LSGSLKSSKSTKPAEETTPHGQADLRAHPGDGVRGKVHPGEGSGEGAFAGNQEVFMPLIHRVGEAQVDFGYALAKVS